MTTLVKNESLFCLVSSCMLGLCAWSIFLLLSEHLLGISSLLLKAVPQRAVSYSLWVSWPYVGPYFGGVPHKVPNIFFFPLSLQSCVPFPWLHWVIWFWLQVKEAVKYALSMGYRHIDCAAAYSNEAEIGEAFQECLGPNKVKTRESPCWLYVASKFTTVTWK